MESPASSTCAASDCLLCSMENDPELEGSDTIDAFLYGFAEGVRSATKTEIRALCERHDRQRADVLEEQGVTFRVHSS